MTRKRDLQRVDWIAKQGGLNHPERIDFGDYIEDCKRKGDFGSLPNGDFTDDELREKLDEFKQGLKRFRKN